MPAETQISCNNVLYRFPGEALTGVSNPIVTASVTREGCGTLTYRVYAQRLQGSRYIYYHGCSLCSLATLIGAFADPSVTPDFLDRHRHQLLRQKTFPALPGRLSRPARMPLNIAGACRILQLHMIRYDFLDNATAASLQAFITAKTEAGLPVLFTGKNIPSLTGEDLCPRGAHTALLIGMKDPNTLIAADSAGSNTQRIKLVSMDDLVSGILTGGIERGLKKSRYYYGPGVRGGVLAPRSWPAL